MKKRGEKESFKLDNLYFIIVLIIVILLGLSVIYLAISKNTKEEKGLSSLNPLSWFISKAASLLSNPECSDGKDNDGDGRCDYSGCYIGRGKNKKWLPKDLDCINGQDNKEATDCIPTIEICDGKDNNCNGQIDESLTRPCSTSCGSGMETCISGTWQNCNAPQPSTEICDGLDNNCDGTIDENNGNCVSLQVCILGKCCLDQNAPFGECDTGGYGLYGAEFYDTSEYLIGKVLIKLFFVESDGSIDANYENWTIDERNIVLNAITNATNWIVSKYPYNHLGDKLSFIIESETVNVSYEPIDRAAGAFGYPNGGGNETIWVQEIMNKKGYNAYNYSTSKYKTYFNVANYLDEQRKAKNTHWAIVIFAVDASPQNPTFTNGQTYFASGTGGPYITIIDYPPVDYRIVAHETLHTFYAMDQYNQPMYNTSSRQGYLDGQNLNYLGAECGGDIMFNLTLNLCSSTKRILGWFDSDSDNIPDILDVEANSILTPYSPDPTTDSTPTYTGSVSTVPFPNQNSHSKYSPLHLTTSEPNEDPDYTIYNWTINDITINTITNVQYRIKDATATVVIDWTNAAASDGAFDSSFENFTFTTAPLSSGTYSVETRTINSVGIIETSYSSDILTIT